VLGKALPGVRPEYATVTLEDLLSHQGGVVQRLDPGQLPAIATAVGSIAQHRAVAAAALSLPPAAPPRTMMIYSNPGYVVAAAMMEQVTGKSWEELVKDEVFTPLHLASAGFGPPEGGVRGHMLTSGGRLVPLDPTDRRSDNPPFLNPAGRVHMSMPDLARFAGDQLDGLGGKPGLLQPQTYQRIHTEHLRHMELGWGGGPSGGFDNSGSNGRWLAYVRAIPSKHMVVAVAVNAVHDPDRDEETAAALVDEVAGQFPN
jgi:CubicO group peptidase (beta-lactamase class C family)